MKVIINERQKLIIQDKVYRIRVKELDAWFPNFQKDDQDDLSSDGESQEGDVANKDDNNESDVDKVSESSFMHENDTAHKDVNSCKKEEKSKVRGSILDLMDELVIVGQTMGYSMAGLRNKAKRRWIKELCQKHRINFSSIQETKAESISLHNIKDLWGNQMFDHVIGSSVGCSRDILCMWNPNVFVKDQVSTCDYFVALMGTWTPTSSKLLIISFYAPQELNERRDLWDYLRTFIDRWEGDTVIMSDFNEVRSEHERIGVSSNVVAVAASLISCSILTAPFNYLGVKVGSNMSRIISWEDVISKVSSRLSKWKLKLLSIGGRLSLLKTVLTSIPLYHMSIFKVPIGVLNHLESIRHNFFYGVDGLDKKLAWIDWNMVLTSKKNGGHGVSSFFAHNRDLLFKWIPRRSPWQDVILAIHSLQSKGINLMDFIQKKVGNSENTSFWDDSWLGEVALKVLYKRLYALEMCKSISVADKMGHPSLSHSFCRMPRGGVEQENYGLLCSKVADLVLPTISDRWCWSLEGSQEF
nr:RNA-directed DNA polymerase, eukaryota [Tanacetum cinerariifolium]